MAAIETRRSRDRQAVRLLPVRAAALVAAWALFPSAARAGTTWDGGGIYTNFTTGANWDDDSAPTFTGGTSTLTFGSGGSTATVDTAANLARIVLDRDAAFTISDGAGSLTLQGELVGGVLTGITASPATAGTTVAYTISESIALGATQSWNVANNGAGTTSLSVSGVISGAGTGLTKRGSGTLVLSGTNTFTGVMSISEGTVSVGSWNLSGSNGVWGNQTNNGSAVTTTFIQMNGGRINYTGASVSGNLRGVNLASGTNTFDVTTGATLNFAANNIFRSTGGSLVKEGGGTLQLGSANVFNNSFSGKVVINAGTLDWFGGGSMPGGNGADFLTINNGGTFALSFSGGSTVGANVGIRLSGEATISSGATGSTPHTIAGPISDGATAGSLRKAGAGGLTLSASNSFTGTTRVTAGTLTINHDSALRSSTLDMNGGDAGAIAFGTLATSPVIGGLAGSRNLSLGNRTVSIGANGQSTTYSGTLSDGSLTKVGAGTLTLQGNSTFSGVTRLDGGVLVVDAAAALASSTIDTRSGAAGSLAFGTAITAATFGGITGSNPLTLTNLAPTPAGVALTVGGNGQSMTFGGSLEGLGSLVKTGAGVLTLSGSSSLAGPTTVSQGAITLTGSLSSAVSVASGAVLSGTGSAGATTILSGGTLTPGVSGVGTLSLGSLTFGAGAGDTAVVPIALLGSGFAPSTAISVGGNVLANGGTGSVTFALGSTLANTQSGTYSLITYGGAQLADTSAFTYSGSVSSRQSVTLANGLGSIDLVVANAQLLWSGSAGNGWSTADNWRFSTDSAPATFAPDDAVVFSDAATTGVVELTAHVTPATVLFSSNTLNYSLSSSGGFGILGGALAKSGSATVTISAVNSYAGGTELAGGILRAGNDAAFGTGPLTLSVGVLTADSSATRTLANDVVINGDVQFGDASGTGPLVLTGSIGLGGQTRTLLVDRHLTLSGVVADAGPGVAAGSIVKTGSGTLALSGNSTLTGGVTLSSGTLIAGSNQAFGSGTLTIGSSAARLGAAGDVTVSNAVNLQQTATIDVAGSPLGLAGVISGTGGFTKVGAGTLTLSGTNTFTGVPSINEGTVSVGSWNLSGSNGVWGNQMNNGSAVTTTFIQMNGGRINYTGLSVSGSLRGVNLASGTNTIDVTNGATLTFAASNIFQSNGGSLVKAGGGTLQLGGGGVANNLFTGSVLINAGTLEWWGGDSMPGGNGPNFLTINNGGTFALSFSGTSTLGINIGIRLAGEATIGSGGTHTIAGPMSDGATAGSLRKAGAGGLILSASNSFTGTTRVTAGTLTINNAAALLASTLDMNAADSGSATFAMNTTLGGLTGSRDLNLGTRTISIGNNDQSTTYSGVLSNGSLTKVGAGALSLTGTSIYSGVTTISAGRLIVDGSILASSGVSVAGGAELGGSGRVAAITGAGLVAPGNSPGIITAPSASLSGGLDFAFEFTQAGAPTWGSAASSGNDVLRLTDATTPLVGTATSGNVFDIYFSAIDDTYIGGIFTDRNSDFGDLLTGATFNYYIRDVGGAFSYGGFNYASLASEDVVRSIVQVASADFAGGTITNGYAMQFVVVPEPGSLALAGLGLAAAAAARLRRRAQEGK